LSIQANAKDVFTPKEPIVIPPGVGLAMWARTTDVGFVAAFEWFEESV
jgi:hypothetical protein